MRQPPSADVWVGLFSEALPVDQAHAWAVLPSCGAVVTFAGTVRDHSPRRDGVSQLEYEAYAEHVERVFTDVAADARTRWPSVGRIAILHRSGVLEVTDTAVVVVASAAHRDAAFDAARFCIDTIKAAAPIWKKETWADGSDWGTDAQLPVGGKR